MCGYKTGVQRSMKSHIDKVHNGLDIEIIYLGDKNLKCYNCDFKTEWKKDLDKHIQEAHEGKQDYRCVICDVSFKSIFNLRVHEGKKGHGKEHLLTVQNWHCDICNLSFKSECKLRDHEGRKSHIKKSNRPVSLVHEQLKTDYLCSICDKYLSTKVKLKKHVTIVHEKLKLFQCSICDYKNGLKDVMKYHIGKVHEGIDAKIIYLGDKNLKCYNCDFTAGMKGDLNKHIIEVHDGKQDWRCDICNISFNTKKILKGHEKIHEGKRTHQCPSCTKSFLRNSCLKRHIQTVHCKSLENSESKKKEEKSLQKRNKDSDETIPTDETNTKNSA